MSRPERRPGTRRPVDTAPSGPTVASYLAPVVPEVAALLGAAERVLVACGRAEDAHADRAIRIAATTDSCTLPVTAVVGPGLPVPLASRVAFRALQRLAVALRPVLREAPGAWTSPAGDDLVAFRALRVDTTDLAILGQAAARLSHPRRTREGTLGGAIESLGPGEPPDHRHPAALGCLLAVVVPVVDPVAVTLHEAAQRHPDVPVLDAAILAAHREVGRRVVGALSRL
ncbi:hypothetical protein LQ327_31705 [Actinomycetospora endophytica]|uniref:Golgi phosphoprotein 3 GPP34 n=1 Tax=Actinomycetospora endophytica TaxID=2291215 RepID=A0ABS8PI60_9PSEU|nr:hypothetical protein [Actinomycetospora endophytica]MCD2197946.1 hypothetical protein [Actinomycetospora endophytica]